ncbi:aminotransferase class IV [Pontibacter sp. 13R65]|uniref:aminotransferase class IV n=1 Tax=Pontibacter sp. 13R65 TaxID=3127458 RepID=UPI00301B99BE
MYLLFNNQLVPEDEMLFYRHNRALQYNDGFFETIVVQEGSVRLWNYHLERIQKAASALKLELDTQLLSKEFPDTILELAEQNLATPFARVKLKIWRSGAGLYTPETSKSDWILTAQPVADFKSTDLDIGICKTVTTSFTPFSFCKGPNSLLYVMAGVEKKESHKQDMLLLDQQGHMAELTSSNIFWFTNNTLFTPPISTGCVQGIMRAYILNWANRKGIKLREETGNVEILRNSETVFAANVFGVRPITRIEQSELPNTSSFLAQLQKNINRIALDK